MAASSYKPYSTILAELFSATLRRLLPAFGVHGCDECSVIGISGPAAGERLCGTRASIRSSYMRSNNKGLFRVVEKVMAPLVASLFDGVHFDAVASSTVSYQVGQMVC